MLSGMRMSVQAELDTFFGHLAGRAQLLRTVSEQAFAQARAKLSLSAIPLLNDWLIARAEQHGFVPCWLVALLNDRAISFCMRAFLRCCLEEQVVTLNAPSRRDATDYEFACAP